MENGADSWKKNSLIDPTQYKMAIFGHIMAKFGQIWVLITILGKDNFTSQFYVKRGGDSRKSNVIERTADKIAIFGHIMAKFGQLWPNLAKNEFNYNFFTRIILQANVM